MNKFKIKKNTLYWGAIVALGICLILINVLPDKPLTILNWILVIAMVCLLTYLGLEDEKNEKERILKAIRGFKKDK